MKVQGTLKQIDNVWLSDDKKDILVYVEELSLAMENKQIKIKIGDSKAKVSMCEFMQAFKDMLDTDLFYMDQIDSIVWETENQLEEIKDKLENAYETLAEIRGGY